MLAKTKPPACHYNELLMDKIIHIIGLTFTFIGAFILWKYVASPVTAGKDAPPVENGTQMADKYVDSAKKNKKHFIFGMVFVSIGLLAEFVHFMIGLVGRG